MINQEILNFFEEISKYYGSEVEITETLCVDANSFDAENSTWNLSRFLLTRSGYRNNGNRFMLEGEKLYVEISAQNIISFSKEGRNKFAFVEQYHPNFYRIIKLRFHYKY